jgi:uncharacterized protein (DUF885 family)
MILIWLPLSLPLLVPAIALAGASGGETGPSKLRALAHDYFIWRNEQYPVTASDQGLHARDDQLADYSREAVEARRERVRRLLEEVRRMPGDRWGREDRIDWLLLLSDLEKADFTGRVIRPEESDPQLYVNECSNAIFSLLKKDYDAPRNRARSAAARLRGMPSLLREGELNLTHPVQPYARLAITAARAMEGLFGESLMTLAKDLPAAERRELVEARDSALNAIRRFADALEKRLPGMVPFRPMGEENYNYYLKHVYLLPLDAKQVAMLGETELARYRALESLLPDPALASPDPARSSRIPADQAAFLKFYEGRQQEIIDFLRSRDLVTLPSYLGPFLIRQLPDAFKPTSPGGFMNAPGLYDGDSSGFYFIPTYDPHSSNFYLRAAIEDPRPILGHEGIPGHFLQISIANHLENEIRREHQDGMFVEGWALYTEEMLARTGLYPRNSASEGQVLRLARYRAARIGADVNLHTGRWSFEQAVRYFMEAGGLDREAAEGEAAGTASDPTQKITYIVGKWQILRLLGRYRDHAGSGFRLGAFHDDLLRHGSLPLSVVEWLMLDDPSTLEEALR